MHRQRCWHIKRAPSSRHSPRLKTLSWFPNGIALAAEGFFPITCPLLSVKGWRDRTHRHVQKTRTWAMPYHYIEADPPIHWQSWIGRKYWRETYYLIYWWARRGTIYLSTEVLVDCLFVWDFNMLGCAFCVVYPNKNIIKWEKCIVVIVLIMKLMKCIETNMGPRHEKKTQA